MSFELEEWVGGIWHRFITRQANREFSAAGVALADLHRNLAVLFRAMGGAGGVALEAADHRNLALRRNLMQRLAGAGHHDRSEEHTSELQSREQLVCRLLLEKKNRA